MKYASFTVLLTILLSVNLTFAQTNWQASDTRQVPGQLELRGFGKVNATISRMHADGQSDVSQATFEAQSPAKAKTLLGKLLAATH